MSPNVIVVIIAVVLFLVVSGLTIWGTVELEEIGQFMILVVELMVFALIFGLFMDSKFMRKNSLDYWKKQVVKYEKLADESKDADDKRYYLEVKVKPARAKYKVYYKSLFGEEDSF